MMRFLLLISMAILAQPLSLNSASAAVASAPTCGGKEITIKGTPGPDTLIGTEGEDVIQGFGGDDSIDGSGGNDTICGGTGRDNIRGGSGDDKLYGESGPDRLSGGGGRDVLHGGRGKDRCIGGSSADRSSGCEPSYATSYRAFDGTTLSVSAYETQTLVFLVSDTVDVDPSEVFDIATVLSRGWKLAHEWSGLTPESNVLLRGRPVVAVVPSTCGAGCGYLGSTGIELTESTFAVLYSNARRNQWDQAVFYEIGRNYSTFHNNVASGPQITGFAIATRFKVIDRLGIRGSRYNGSIPYPQFEFGVRNLVHRDSLDRSATFWNTIYTDSRLESGPSWASASDLVASYYLHFGDRYGESFYPSFFAELSALPDADSEEQGIDNIVLAASLASGENLAKIAKNDWQWPVSSRVTSRLDHLPHAVDLQVGGIDVQQYCQTHFPGSNVTLRFDNAFGWRCQTRSGERFVDMGEACREQYRGLTFAKPESRAWDSWACYR